MGQTDRRTADGFIALAAMLNAPIAYSIPFREPVVSQPVIQSVCRLGSPLRSCGSCAPFQHDRRVTQWSVLVSGQCSIVTDRARLTQPRPRPVLAQVSGSIIFCSPIGRRSAARGVVQETSRTTSRNIPYKFHEVDFELLIYHESVNVSIHFFQTFSKDANARVPKNADHIVVRL